MSRWKGLLLPALLVLVFAPAFLCYSRVLLAMRAFMGGPTLLAGVVQFAVAEHGPLAPKVVIVDYYGDEGSAWLGIPEFDLLARNITVPGLSRRYSSVRCTSDGDICQLLTDEGLINAALSTGALVQSPAFDLRQSYFLLAGVAGISPKFGTLGSVAFARFSVQVALQYEVDAREIPAEFNTGYIPQGTTAPGQWPRYVYGTEAFELNDALRQRAVTFAKRAMLNDSASAQAYRALYAGVPEHAAALQAPSVVACDTATSDVWWSGALLAEAFENTTTLLTNGTGTYCTTQQEDGAVLGALLRGALTGRVDFARVISMRTASDFDRPAPGMSATANLFEGQSAGYRVSVVNIYRAGVQVIQGILDDWYDDYAKGIPPSNYIGDDIGSLGGHPDFGPGSRFGGLPPDLSDVLPIL
ncbi:purine nucleoside permease [Dichomitus squalens]|nr:purine nucleoside permease [Dichomitus squalens]